MAVAARIWLVAAAAALLFAAVPAVGSAHNMPTSEVQLDIGADQVTGDVRLPVDRLAVALGRELTPAQAAGADLPAIRRYARAHIKATGTNGRAWDVVVTGGKIERQAAVDDLVLHLALVPPDGVVTRFDLAYDVIIEQLVTHRAIATIRSQFDAGTTATDPETLGVFDWSTKTLSVDGGRGSWLRGTASMAGLGVKHIGEGADHLLFLLMLLIPAPLIAVRGRWRRRDDARTSVKRVVHVVTAFAIGHSTTLALGALGLMHLPSRLVESLIALSIFVSAIHAIRPLVPGGEAVIAAGFGLVHGLAFATLLGDMGLTGGSLVLSLLGFNLGIEATQLLVVALMMPSLYVLSRTGAYSAIRVLVAGFGLVLSAGWFLERTGLIPSDPFAGLSNALIERPFAIATVFALLALIAWYIPLSRLTPGAVHE